MKKADMLYAMAVAHLGTDASPNDQAPDEYGCAETVDDIYFKLFGRYIGPQKTLSTYWMYKYLKESPNFQRITEPEPGCIIISPTGYGNGKVKNGHVGVYGKHGVIMSNNSPTGTFEENMTDAYWKRYYRDKGGYDIHYFRPI